MGEAKNIYFTCLKFPYFKNFLCSNNTPARNEQQNGFRQHLEFPPQEVRPRLALLPSLQQRARIDPQIRSQHVPSVFPSIRQRHRLQEDGLKRSGKIGDDGALWDKTRPSTTVRRRREDGLKTEADANAIWHAEAVVDPASIGGSWVFLRSNSISRSLLPGPRFDHFIIVTFLCAYFEKKNTFKW